jgi:hypothetical protein
MRIFEVIRPEKSEVMVGVIVFCYLEHNSAKKWLGKGKFAWIRRNSVFRINWKEGVAIFAKQWIRSVLKKWGNEWFVIITELLKPGCCQIIAHQNMSYPVLLHKLQYSHFLIVCPEKFRKESGRVERLFKNRLKIHVIPSVPEKDAQHSGLRWKLCVGVLNRGKLWTIGSDVFVTTDIPLNERDGVDQCKLCPDI